jgi:hypothetical protein
LQLVVFLFQQSQNLRQHDKLHDDLGLTMQPTTYPSVPDLSRWRLRVA